MSREAIDKGHELFLAAMEANDPQALGRLCANDALFMPPNEASVVGSTGVANWYDGVVKQARTNNVTVSNRNVVVSGDIGYERGIFVWQLTPLAGGGPIQSRGNFLAIWRRETDGTWKIVHNIWNSLEPPKAN